MSDIGISIGAQHGTPPPNTAGAHNPNLDGTSTAAPQAEIGYTADSFEVFQGKTEENPTDAPPGWRWIHKNGLHAHDVPAVDEFRKAIEAAEKQAAAQQQSKPQQQGKYP